MVNIRKQKIKSKRFYVFYLENVEFFGKSQRPAPLWRGGYLREG